MPEPPLDEPEYEYPTEEDLMDIGDRQYHEWVDEQVEKYYEQMEDEG